MEDDYTRPRERERKLKSNARRKGNWTARRWSKSKAGNSYLNTPDYNLTVFRNSGRSQGWWSIVVTNRVTLAKQDGHKKFATEDEAKSSAFDALLWAEEHLR
ncbi:MAG: hypothetical protein P4M05_27615 [Bradyrhizobium sp.]|nr:hypothetical protein [Bradyrhizobium sp.]